MKVKELREILSSESVKDDMNVWLIASNGAPTKTDPDVFVNGPGGPYDDDACVIIMQGDEGEWFE